MHVSDGHAVQKGVFSDFNGRALKRPAFVMDVSPEQPALRVNGIKTISFSGPAFKRVTCCIDEFLRDVSSIKFDFVSHGVVVYLVRMLSRFDTSIVIGEMKKGACGPDR